MRDALRSKIRQLPNQPGIYIFKGADEAVLYVGKAISLRKRVASYQKVGFEPRLRNMVAEAVDLDFLVTDSEAEALLLENNWIKRTQPRYNIRLRDDKTYPYLKLTLRDEYPRLAFTRRIVKDGAEYYGPFLPGGLARKAIKLTQKLFGIRVCRIEIDGKLPRPCLYYDMKRCLGPCVDGLVSLGDYDAATQQARLFLQGRNEKLLRAMRRDMSHAAEALEFEQAAQFRDAIYEVESVSQRRKLSSERGDNVDIYGVHIEGDSAAMLILVMRGGQVLDRREIFWEGTEGMTERGLLSEVLPQIYDRTTLIPKEIHVPCPIDGEAALLGWLSERKEERVYLRMPSRGPKADRMALAQRNARLGFRRRFKGSEGAAAANALQQALGLSEPPRHIEGFDISTFHGAQSVASLVVWRDGKMRKSDYRSFNIKGLEQADDFYSMHQAVARRYRRVLEEIGEMPDLILVDGGRGQLNAALDALAELGVDETPIVGLAKQEEEIYLPERPDPLRLPRTDAGLLALQRVRDEAHRFAVSRHRRRRSRSSLRSGFDGLSGVGDKRRKLLIRRFGSFRGVKAASQEELVEVLGARIGSRVFDQLNS